MSYCLVVYCSEKQKDVLDITLPSWLRSDAEKVYIYTDTNLKIPNSDKLRVLKIFRETDDIGSHYSRKAESVLDVKRHRETLDIVSIDADCYITNMLDDLIEDKFDIMVSIGPTAKPQKPFNNVSPGFVCLKNTMMSSFFLKDWIMTQEKNKRVRPRDQLSLSQTLTRFYQQNSAIIKCVPESWCNCYPVYIDKLSIHNWIDGMEKNIATTRIVHFSFGLWRNEQLVKYVLSIFGDRHGSKMV